ncbi:capsid protein [Bradyrhizobium sp. 83012]|uniref:Capsid protein n=1 Tax=Bradyrhizobium aeschynomenes TaxID=2734909 RepID=A0ABX2C8M4_9BRAD|nr:capsid protein [Bradyrhizobium aeschynomenes]
MGKASSRYHTPGQWIDGTAIAHAEKVITIDDLLIADTFIANIDEAMNHYDVRGPYSQELGRELAQAFDTNVARNMVLAARASNPLASRPGGTRISNAAMDTDKDALRTSLFTAAQKLDEKNVPSEDRSAFFRPAQFYLMAQDTTLINKFYGETGGDLGKGSLETVAGFPIVKSNNVPAANDSANTEVHSKYRADFSATVGVVSHKMAAGTVKLMDLAMDAQYEPRRQGTFMVAKYAVGHDWLRPECAVELYKA